MVPSTPQLRLNPGKVMGNAVQNYYSDSQESPTEAAAAAAAATALANGFG